MVSMFVDQKVVGLNHIHVRWAKVYHIELGLKYVHFGFRLAYLKFILTYIMVSLIIRMVSRQIFWPSC